MFGPTWTRDARRRDGDDRPAAPPAPPGTGPLTAGALGPGRVLRVHLADRGRLTAAVRQGAACPGAEAPRLARVPRDGLGAARRRQPGAPARRRGARAAARRRPRRGGEEARDAARRGDDRPPRPGRPPRGRAAGRGPPRRDAASRPSAMATTPGRSPPPSRSRTLRRFLPR